MGTKGMNNRHLIGDKKMLSLTSNQEKEKLEQQ